MAEYMKKCMYIIGAGFAGRMLAKEICQKKLFGEVAAFLDDDPELIGKTLDGIPVLGPIAHFTSFLRHTERDEAIIAIPSAPKERISEIYNLLTKSGFSRIRILPCIADCRRRCTPYSNERNRSAGHSWQNTRNNSFKRESPISAW